MGDTGTKRGWRYWAELVIGLLGLAGVVFLFSLPLLPIDIEIPIVPVRIQSNSMNPVFKNGYRIGVYIWAYRHRLPETGEIVACNLEDSVPGIKDPHATVRVGRVVPCAGQDPRKGLYKDWFEEDPGQPFICIAYDNPAWKAREGENPVPVAAIEGEAIVIFSPLSAAGRIPPWKGKREGE